MDFSPLIISIQVAISATLISIVCGGVLNYFVFRYQNYKHILDTICTLPIVLPPTVIGMILLICFGNNSFFGKILNTVGISIVFSIQGAIVAASIVAIPLFFRSMLSAVEGIDQELLYVGRTLGMTEFNLFIKVILPQIRHAILAGTILSFTRALGEFGATLMLAGNIPGRTQTMSIAIYTAIQSGDNQVAYIWGTIIILFSLVSIGIIKKYGHTK